jgi:hypothetical protein
MSTITVDDKIREALELNAAYRGLTLSDYLKLIATTDAPARTAERSLTEILAPVLAEARLSTPEPRSAPADPLKAGFDAAMTEKYRKQGFNL